MQNSDKMTGNFQVSILKFKPEFILKWNQIQAKLDFLASWVLL